MVKESTLITGGAGYIGSVLSKNLLEKGYKVTCFDNLVYHQKSPLNFVSDSNYKFVYGDVRDRKTLKELVQKNDVIVPLAALVGMPLCERKPSEAKQINEEEVIFVNNLRTKNQKMIFPNTNSGYGASTGEFFCTEETPLKPISVYGITKCNAEKALLSDPEKSAVTFRLATAFGVSPRMRTDLMVNDFTLKAKRDGYIIIYQGDFKRNFIHVKDVAEGFAYAIENFDSMKGLPYNLGLDEANMSKKELAFKIKNFVPNFEIISKEIGEDVDKRNYLVSNERIHKAGFRPKHSLEEGIEELLEAYDIILRNNPYGNV